jgi:hypothetical protein
MRINVHSNACNPWKYGVYLKKGDDFLRCKHHGLVHITRQTTCFVRSKRMFLITLMRGTLEIVNSPCIFSVWFVNFTFWSCDIACNNNHHNTYKCLSS